MSKRRELKNRGKFDAKRDLVTNRPMTLVGYSYERGQAVKTTGKHAVPLKVRTRFWASHRLVYKEDYQPIETVDVDENLDNDGDLDDNHNDDDVILLGSDIQPATWPSTTEGAPDIILGDIVAAAHQDSELSATEWNELESDDREARIATVVTSMGLDPVVEEDAGSDDEIKSDADIDVKDNGDGTFSADADQSTLDVDADQIAADAKPANVADAVKNAEKVKPAKKSKAKKDK